MVCGCDIHHYLLLLLIRLFNTFFHATTPPLLHPLYCTPPPSYEPSHMILVHSLVTLTSSIITSIATFIIIFLSHHIFITTHTINSHNVDEQVVIAEKANQEEKARQAISEKKLKDAEKKFEEKQRVHREYMADAAAKLGSTAHPSIHPTNASYYILNHPLTPLINTLL